MSKKKQRSDFESTTSLVNEVVKVVWEDTLHMEEVTQEQIEREPPLLFTSYGIVLHFSEEYLIVAGHFSNQVQNRIYREALKIPKSVIREIKVLREVAPTS